MRSRSISTVATAGLGLALSYGAASAAEPSPEAMVDALAAVFGSHKVRGSHAKGTCTKGKFTPTHEAEALSKASIFTKSGSATVRFSMAGGNPKIPDKAKPAVRGLAVKFDAGKGSTVDLVMISAPVFFARTPEQFVGFLQARIPQLDGKGPDQAKIKAFTEANPETGRQGAWLNSHPVPASYAGVNYWAVHAYTLTSAAATASNVKFKMVPSAEANLTDDEAKAKPNDFYADELKERLAKGPAKFDLLAIHADAADTLDDPTVQWPEDTRKTTKLGTLEVTAIEPDTTCDASTFDPANLVDGIAGPKHDAIFPVRSPAYAVSLTRRAQ